MFNKRNKKRGFTLIELIIVIAIIAILAAIAVPAFGTVTKNAKIKTDISNARTIYSAVMVEVAEGNTDIYNEDDNTVDLTKLKSLDVVPKPEAVTGEFTATVTNEKVVITINDVEIYPNSNDYPSH